MDKSFSYSTRLGPDEIRLLRVHQAAKDDLIRCSLSVHKSADVQNKYSALSYTWGSPDLTQHVSCNDTDLCITANLHAALRQHRASNDSQPLWVDAICINQTDTLEKTVQVRKMKAIYENAERVIIWIGEKHDDDVHGLDLIKQLAGTPSVIEAMDAHKIYLDLAAEGLPSLEDPAWASMLGLVTRPWFSRTWVIQEAIVNDNTTFRCGDIEIPFETVLTTGNLMCFWNIRSWIQLQFAHGLVKAWNPQQSQNKMPNIINHAFMKLALQNREDYTSFRYVLHSRAFEATDPRDKIFSIIGLTRDIPNELINYEDDLNRVICKFTCKLIVASHESEGHHPISPVKIIAWARIYRNPLATLSLPTWVPDFSNSQVIGCTVALWYEALNLEPVKIDGIGEWQINEEQDSESLESVISLSTRARHFDTIQKTFRTSVMAGYTAEASLYISADPDRFRREQDSYVRDALDLVTNSCPGLPPEEVEETLWRTLVCNRGRTGAPLTESDWQSFQAARRWFRTGTNDALSDELIHAAAQFLDAAGTIGAHRVLFVSQNGRAGMAPNDAEPGDQIHYFLGSRFPLVLRPAAQKYAVVGDCYLHGVMNGRAHDDLSSFRPTELV